MALPIQTGNGICCLLLLWKCAMRTTTTASAIAAAAAVARMTRGHDRVGRVSAAPFDFSLVSNEFAKDDWNVMHVAARHSATWRNTYQPQILPYILNIVTLTAIAYSSKRIYWHRARFAWNCWLAAECKHTFVCTGEHVLNTIQANLQPSTLGRRLKSFAHSQHFEMGLSEKWSKEQQQQQQHSNEWMNEYERRVQDKLSKINHSHVQRAEFLPFNRRNVISNP